MNAIDNPIDKVPLRKSAYPLRSLRFISFNRKERRENAEVRRKKVFY